MERNKHNKEIVILSQYFYPDIASTGLLMTDLCIGFIKKGFSVRVFTAKPNYDNKIKADTEENYKGIVIKRLFCSRLNKNNKIGSLINSLTYYISVLSYLLFIDFKGTLLIVSNPPFLPIAGLIIKFLKGNEFIYLIHDLFPDAGINLGLFKETSMIAKLWDLFNKHIFRSSKYIVVLGNSMKEVIIKKIIKFELNKEKYSTLNNKIKVIHNWANEDLCIKIAKKDNPFIKKFNVENKFVVMYSGNLSKSYNLNLIISAAKIITDSEIVFIFIGDGSHKIELMELKEKYHLDNVYFYPYQKISDVKYSLNSADVLILSTKLDFDGLSVPSKLYTYLASGKTVIAFSEKNSDIDKIISDASCGFCFSHDEIDNFMNKLIFLKNNKEIVKKYSENASKYFNNNFSYEIALNKYIELFN